MKKVASMDKVLRNSESNANYLTHILPEFQSFSGYGKILPYVHYQVRINDICDKWQDSDRMAIIIKVLTDAYIQFCSGKLDRALELVSDLSETHDLSINPEHFGFSELILGVCTRSIGHIDKAVVHLINCIQSIDEFGSLAKISCLANYQLAELHLQITDIDNAGSFYKKALGIAERVKNKLIVFRSLSGLGSWYHSRGEYDKSLQYFKQALMIEPINQTLKSRVLCDIGKHHIALKQYEEALTALKESYQMANEGKYLDSASTSLTHMGEAYLELNKPTEALKVLNEALEVALKLKTSAKQMEIEALLARVYESKADYQKAYGHLKSAQLINQEIYTNRQGEVFQVYNRRIEQQKETIIKERDKSEKLLLNILPFKVAQELKETGKAKPRRFENVTILFSDFQGFTELVASIPPITLIEELNDIFSHFDDIMGDEGVEKIETIRDAYLAAAGLPEEAPDHAVRCVLAAKRMIDFLKQRNARNKIKWKMRIGIHSGPVVAGVVGKKKFAYDLFGDTINTASRIETAGEAGKINVSASTYHLIKNKFDCTARGKIAAKGKGEIEMWFVTKKSE